MGIRVNEHESLTLSLGDVELTVGTKSLFDAWMQKNIVQHQTPKTAVCIPQPRKGERYLGSITEPDGRTRHVFLLPGDEKKNWKDGLAWAKEQGGDLPDRVEQAMAYAYMLDEFQKEAYWSNTQHAGYSYYAWYQNFSYGRQYYTRKNGELRVRAVRREFSDSVI